MLEGNKAEKREENPIIYGWDTIKFGYSQGTSPDFSDFYYQSLKYFIVSSFGRLVSDNKEHLTLSGSQSKDGGDNTLLKAFSTINSQAVEILLSSLIKTLFSKLEIFVQEYEAYTPGNYFIYSNFREKGSENPYKDCLDPQTGFFHSEAQEEEIKEDSENFYQKVVERETKRELSKGAKISKYFESALVMLRLFEYILTISMKTKEAQEFVKKAITPEFTYNTIKIAFMGHVRYSYLAIKVLEKMVKLGLTDADFSEALEPLSQNKFFNDFLTGNKKVYSEKSVFLSLLLSKIAQIQGYKWKMDDHCHSQEFSTSKKLVLLVRQMILSPHEPVWSSEYQRMVTDLTQNEEEYQIQEFETLMAPIGGQTVTCDYGTKGVVGNKNITILGYSEDYKSHPLDPSKWDLKFNWSDPKQSIIVKINDSDSKRKYKIESIKQKDLDFIQKFSKENCPVLGKDQISYLLLNDSLQGKSDLNELYKRFIKLNALSRQLSFNSISEIGLDITQTSELLKNCLVKFLESKAAIKTNFNQIWYQLQLNELLKYASETRISLAFVHNLSCSFEDKYLIFKNQHQDLDESVEFMKILKAMNYPTINGLRDFSILREKDLSDGKHGAVLVDSFKLSDEHEIVKIFQKANVIITNPCDLKNLYQSVKSFNPGWLVSKSLVVISEVDFQKIHSLLGEVQDSSPTLFSPVDIKQEFITEMAKNTGISRKFIQDSIVKRDIDRISYMTKDFVDKCEETEPVMASEDEKEEILDSEPQLEKENYEIIFDSDKIRDSLDSKLNLENFRKNLTNFCEYKAKGKSGNIKSVDDRDIFDFITNFNQENYLQQLNDSVQINCRLICQKIIQDITETSVEEVIDLICKEKSVMNMFIRYLSKSVDPSHKSQYLKLISKMLGICREKNLTELEDLLYKELVINSLEKIFTIVFEKDTYNLEWVSENIDRVDIHTILGILKIFTEKANVDVIYRNHEIFDILLTDLLYLLLQFSQDGDHKKDSIAIIYKLLVPVVFNSEDYHIQIKHAFLNNLTINALLEKYDFSVNINSNKTIPPENKMIIQMLILLKNLSRNQKEVLCRYQWRNEFTDLVQANTILSDDSKFEFVSYLLYYNEFIKGTEHDNQNVPVKVPKNLPD